jgi:hypothetical protein
MNADVRLSNPPALNSVPSTQEFCNEHRATIVGEALQNLEDKCIKICVGDGGEVLRSGTPDASKATVVKSFLREKWATRRC